MTGDDLLKDLETTAGGGGLGRGWAIAARGGGLGRGWAITVGGGAVGGGWVTTVGDTLLEVVGTSDTPLRLGTI